MDEEAIQTEELASIQLEGDDVVIDMEGVVVEGGVTSGGVTEGGVTEGVVTESGVTKDDVTEGEVTRGEVIEGGVTEDGVTEGDVVAGGVEGGVTEEQDKGAEQGDGSVEPPPTPTEGLEGQLPLAEGADIFNDDSKLRSSSNIISY